MMNIAIGGIAVITFLPHFYKYMSKEKEDCEEQFTDDKSSLWEGIGCFLMFLGLGIFVLCFCLGIYILAYHK